MDNTVLIVGMGYVGLTLSASLLKNTKLVISGLEKNKTIVSNLNSGRSHIYEPNINKIIKLGLSSKRIKFISKLNNKIKFKTIVICVGTPLNFNTKKVINKSIIETCKEIERHMYNDSLIILRSTVQIGTTRKLLKKNLSKKNKFISIAYCPERTIEGNAIYEVNNLPQLIGTEDSISKKMAEKFFFLFNRNIVHLNLFEKAELIKLIDNSFRDTYFAMSNQIGLICKKLKFSSNEIIEKANYKFKRTNLAQIGPVGGPCLSKDPYILGQTYKNSIFQKGRIINENFVKTGCKEVENIINLNFKNKRQVNILIFGAAFKIRPPTNDIRFSCAVNVTAHILNKNKNCKIFIYDKLVSEKDINNLGASKINNIKNYKKADILIINSYDENLEKTKLKTLLKNSNQNLIIYSFWFINKLKNLKKKKQKLFFLAD